jgi:hypothetical protein
MDMRTIKRRILAGAAAAALAAWPQLGGASSDFGCEATWKLAVSGYECGGSGLIGPRNDTRINLTWLLRDRAGISTPGKLAYPSPDWYGAGYGHVFLSWDTMQAAFWPRPEGDDGEEGDGIPYYGSRCQTLASGGEVFQSALASAKGLKAGEREALVKARELLKPACDGQAGEAAWPTGISSPTGLAYLAYLQGARGFYADDFATARSRFADLAKARDGWLAETARYMTARNELAAAMAGGFNEWGGFDLEKVDRAVAARGGAALDAYLQAYPSGRYATSAKGLKRRAAWLAGQDAPLARTYTGMLVAQPLLDAGTPMLMEEIDAKQLFGIGLSDDAQAPLLLATWDLLRMRSSDPEIAEYVPKPLTAAELAAQAPAFAKDPDLYGFLQASLAFHVAQDYRRVTALIADDARRDSYTPLAFSRQMLRGLALEKLGDRNAAGFWQELVGGTKDLYQRPAVELALAMNWERHGALDRVFAAGSPVTEPEIRSILLQHVAGAELLRSRAGAASRLEREVALFTLLYKDLSRGRFADFGRDVALVPAGAGSAGWVAGWSNDAWQQVPLALFTKGRWEAGYPCPAVARTAATLASRPTDVKARLCLGEFYRLNDFDMYLSGEGTPPEDQLGGSPTQFTGKVTNRADIYAAVLADRSAGPDDTAYALYRAVMCYAPSGNNSCSKDDVPVAQRKAWHDRLKREFPKSKWAIELKYYW